MAQEKARGSIAKAEQTWEESVLKERMAKVPELRESFSTDSLIPIKRVYTPDDLHGVDYLRDIGFPGMFPFTRGIQPTMYRSRHWTMRQYAGFGTARETNTRYRYLLDHGQTGLSVAFDLPTQIGYDSDHSFAQGELGKVGVAIDSLRDMEILFEGIPLDQVSTSMTINATASLLLAMYITVAQKQGVSPAQLRGTIQNDILKEYIARGTYIYPLSPSLRLITDVLTYCKDHVPKWNPISVSGYHIREAGSTAIQEVTFTLANAVEYANAALRAGLTIDEFAQRVSFFFNVHNHFFEEIAKFRAARRLWARIMRERFKAKDDRSCLLRFHAQTAGSALTAEEAENNVARSTLHTLAAVLGGAQSIHTSARDEALALPSEESARIALRTQQIIAFETGVADGVDPLGGSYYIETLTDEIEERARAGMEDIEGRGGMLKAIEEGYIQKEIERSAYRYQHSVESGDRTVVGVNRFRAGQKLAFQIQTVDPLLAEKQREALKALRRERDEKRVRKVLDVVREVAASDDNLMPAIIEAVSTYATLGEIADVLRKVFGEHQEGRSI